jgi:hypothetical protein
LEGKMIKDVLVHLDGSGEDEFRLQHAEAISAGSDAHLTGLFTNPVMKLAHERLHEELVRATKAGGQVGEAARALARVLLPHLVKEAFAFPPLAAMSKIARGGIGYGPLSRSVRSRSG